VDYLFKTYKMLLKITRDHFFIICKLIPPENFVSLCSTSN